MIQKTLQERFAEDDRFEELIFYDGFDDAFIGLGCQFNKMSVVYNRQKCIEILMQDMSEEDAEEYFEFNCLNAFVGDSTPIFFVPIQPTSILENGVWF